MSFCGPVKTWSALMTKAVNTLMPQSIQKSRLLNRRYLINPIMTAAAEGKQENRHHAFCHSRHLPRGREKDDPTKRKCQERKQAKEGDVADSAEVFHYVIWVDGNGVSLCRLRAHSLSG